MATQKDAELLVLLLRWSSEMGADQQGHQLPLKYWGWCGPRAIVWLRPSGAATEPLLAQGCSRNGGYWSVTRTMA